MQRFSHSDMPEWDSSFNQILNRTRQNINRINQRYVPTNPQFEVASTKFQQVDDPKYSWPDVMSVHAGSPPRKSEYRPQTREFTEPPQQLRHTTSSSSNTIAVEASTFTQILDRVCKLEANNDAKDAIYEKRLSNLEKSVDSIRLSLDGLGADVKEISRAKMQTASALQQHVNILETLQAGMDNSRGSMFKLETWARQMDNWREGVDSQISNLTKQQRASDRQSQDFRTNEGAWKPDMDLFKIKMETYTQQMIAANMTVWYDKIESNVRLLEKQIAALRIGGTLGPQFDLNEQQVKQALATQAPSELLLRGVVSSEMRTLEESIESKLEARVKTAVMSQLFESERLLRQDMKQSFRQIASEMGLTSENAEQSASDEHTSSASAASSHDNTHVATSSLPQFRSNSARKSIEREFDLLANKLDDVTGAVITIQENHAATEAGLRLDMKGLERRLDETVSQCHHSVTNTQGRIDRLDDMRRQSDDTFTASVSKTREEFLRQLHDISDEFLDHRATLDRRVAIVERCAADLVESQKVSQGAMEAHLLSSPHIKKLELAANKVEQIQIELSSLKSELRQSDSLLTKLDATAARKQELSDVRERLAVVEPLVEQVSNHNKSLSRLGEDMSRVSSSQVTGDSNMAATKTDLRTLADKLASLDATTGSTKTTVSYLEKESTLYGQKLQHLESTWMAEMQHIKDGAMSSERQSNDLRTQVTVSTAQATNNNTKIQALETVMATLSNALNQTQSSRHSDALQHQDISNRVSKLERMQFYQKNDEKAEMMQQPQSSPLKRGYSVSKYAKTDLVSSLSVDQIAAEEDETIVQPQVPIVSAEGPSAALDLNAHGNESSDESESNEPAVNSNISLHVDTVERNERIGSFGLQDADEFDASGDVESFQLPSPSPQKTRSTVGQFTDNIESTEDEPINVAHHDSDVAEGCEDDDDSLSKRNDDFVHHISEADVLEAVSPPRGFSKFNDFDNSFDDSTNDVILPQVLKSTAKVQQSCPVDDSIQDIPSLGDEAVDEENSDQYDNDQQPEHEFSGSSKSQQPPLVETDDMSSDRLDEQADDLSPSNTRPLDNSFDSSNDLESVASPMQLKSSSIPSKNLDVGVNDDSFIDIPAMPTTPLIPPLNFKLNSLAPPQSDSFDELDEIRDARDSHSDGMVVENENVPFLTSRISDNHSDTQLSDSDEDEDADDVDMDAKRFSNTIAKETPVKLVDQFDVADGGDDASSDSGSDVSMPQCVADHTASSPVKQDEDVDQQDDFVESFHNDDSLPDNSQMVGVSNNWDDESHEQIMNGANEQLDLKYLPEISTPSLLPEEQQIQIPSQLKSNDTIDSIDVDAQVMNCSAGSWDASLVSTSLLPDSATSTPIKSPVKSCLLEIPTDIDSAKVLDSESLMAQTTTSGLLANPKLSFKERMKLKQEDMKQKKTNTLSASVESYTDQARPIDEVPEHVALPSPPAVSSCLNAGQDKDAVTSFSFASDDGDNSSFSMLHTPGNTSMEPVRNAASNSYEDEDLSFDKDKPTKPIDCTSESVAGVEPESHTVTVPPVISRPPTPPPIEVQSPLPAATPVAPVQATGAVVEPPSTVSSAATNNPPAEESAAAPAKLSIKERLKQKQELLKQAKAREAQALAAANDLSNIQGNSSAVNISVDNESNGSMLNDT